jgi:hypothetical protein
MAEEIKNKTLYELLSAPLPEEAIQRTEKEKTKKGYDTTGFGYQFIVNRFNEVLGIGGWNWSFVESKEDRIEGEYSSSKAKYYDLTGEATITIFANNKFNLIESLSHSETGGHKSATIADAKKGASTNALKKTAGFFGVGRQAFEKTIDDDNKEQNEGKKPKPVRTVESIIGEIKKCKKDSHIKEWTDWINKCSYTEPQKNVMRMALEEAKKKISVH